MLKFILFIAANTTIYNNAVVTDMGFCGSEVYAQTSMGPKAGLWFMNYSITLVPNVQMVCTSTPATISCITL